MRKTIIGLLFLLTSINVYPQAGINWGILGSGFSGTKGIDGGYVYAEALVFSYEANFGLGFSVSPLNIQYYFAGKKNDIITFVNVSGYFDFFKDDSLLLAPYVMLRVIDCNKFDFAELRGGIRFSINNLLEIFGSDKEIDRLIFKNLSLMAELGYSYNKAQQGYYAHIGIDIISALFWMGYGRFGEKPQKQMEF
jgi:hypothetical protein